MLALAGPDVVFGNVGNIDPPFGVVTFILPS